MSEPGRGASARHVIVSARRAVGIDHGADRTSSADAPLPPGARGSLSRCARPVEVPSFVDEPEQPVAPDAATDQPAFSDGPPVPPPPAPPRRRSGGARAAIAFFVVIVVFVGGIGIWGFVHHPGYDQFLPGDALAVEPLIGVQGARAYPTKGDVYLLFVRQRSNLNEWQYLWAKTFKGDSDLLPTQPGSQTANERQDVCDMTDSQASAKYVALTKLGYKVSTRPGVVVTAVGGGVPAASILDCDDVILSVDGQPTNSPAALRDVVTRHKPGDVVAVTFERAGHRMTRSVKLVKDPDTGNTVIGVLPADQYVYPVKLSIDTADIGGPSAGLAMTLGLLDQLTPGNLTGGKRVAVTGTIDTDGNVGEIGEIRLKAIAARRRGVQIFLVPACTLPEAQDPTCRPDLAAAEKEAKGVKVIPVKTLDDALRALVANGGDPLPAPTAR